MTENIGGSTIGFGGGCHWCTEAVFQGLRGVSKVEQGFIQSRAPYDSFSEGVIVSFDPDVISLMVLTDVHLRTHASGADHSMRSKYRSAIYVTSAAQRTDSEMVLKELQSTFDTPRITKVLELEAFKASEPSFQNYYKSGPERPFCKTYINPKLARMRKLYADFLVCGHSV